MLANRIAAASHLGLFCLPMSNKKDVRLIFINPFSFGDLGLFNLLIGQVFLASR